MKNNIKDLSLELIKDIKSLEGFKSPLIEEELIHNLSIKIDNLTGKEKDERIKALRNMFALGQIFANQNKEEIINELKLIGNYFDVSKLDVYEHKHHIRFTSIIKDRIDFYVNK